MHRCPELDWRLPADLIRRLCGMHDTAFDDLAEEDTIREYSGMLTEMAVSLSELVDKINSAEKRRLNRRLVTLEREKRDLAGDKRKLEEEAEAKRSELQVRLEETRIERDHEEANKDQALQLVEALTEERNTLAENVRDLEAVMAARSKTVAVVRSEKSTSRKRRRWL